MPAATAGSSALARALHAGGFGVAIVDMSQFYMAAGSGANDTNDANAAANIDAAVEALHRAVRSLDSGVPPVAIAHGLGASLAQAYLESYALSGLAMLAPLHPDPRVTLGRWAPSLETAPPASAAAALAAAFLAASATCGGSSGVALTPAAAAGAAALALSLPKVLLEPSPVPLLGLRGAHDAWCSTSDLAAVAAHHGLGEREARSLGGAAAADYDVGFSGEAERGVVLKDALLEWILGRF